jgi:hypothetical protein
MTARNVRREGREEEYTALPKGWVPVPEYDNHGRPADSKEIFDAGWCPKCKEALDSCTCHPVTDIFDDANKG